MTEQQAVAAILIELARARAKHPLWPTDRVHQAAIVAEECGELVKASVQVHYGEDATQADIDREAIHTAATCVRLLVRG